MSNSNSNPPPDPSTITVPNSTTAGGTTYTFPINTSATNVIVTPNTIQWMTWVPGPVVTVSQDPGKSKKKDKDGCDCTNCKEFYPYAIENQEDGTFMCYKCRIGW